MSEIKRERERERGGGGGDGAGDVTATLNEETYQIFTSRHHLRPLPNQCTTLIHRWGGCGESD